jgi:predicted small lipoprotein YifL
MFCWSRYLFYLVVIILGLSSMLSACGQKGPLVLPDENTSSQSPAAAEQQAGASD